MPYDGLPGEPGTPHPLESFAPASLRDTISFVCASKANAILDSWKCAIQRTDGDAMASLPEDILRSALEAYLELFRYGTLHRMFTLFEQVMRDGSARVTLSHEADRIHRVLSTLPVAVLPALETGFRDERTRLCEAMSLVLGATQMAAQCLYHVLERMMTAEVQQAHDQQLRFFQEITRLATGNRLRLVEPHEIPSPVGGPYPIQELQDGSRFRQAAASIAAGARMERSRQDDLTLAVGEAVSNVLKHAGAGVAHAWHEDDVVYAFIADTGRGITLENLPRALTPGWSSEPSLGMGFTLMLEMSDVIWLSTGPYGTTVCIEKYVSPRTDPLLETLLRDDRY